MTKFKFKPFTGGLLIGLLFMFLFMHQCSKPNKTVLDETRIEAGDKSVVVKLVTKLDTIYLKKNVYKTDTVKVPTLMASDTVFLPTPGGVIREVAQMPMIKRVYEDSIRFDSVSVGYVARTTGTLDGIKLSYRDLRADKLIVRTNDYSIIRTITPKGLYIGVEGSFGTKEVSPTLQYLNNRDIYGIKYNLISTPGIQNIGVSYSRKLF